jgi:hypothetical protein
MLVLSAIAPGAVLQVPGGYPSIQAAMDAAQQGDTVLVAQGTYHERIDFKGKEITVVSSHGAASTVIDGGQAGSVVTFSSLEGPGAVLQGFTITNGTGIFLGNFYYGGGIYIKLSSPSILDNLITDNHCGKGGGITCDEGAPLIRGNRIHHNTAVYAAGLQVEFDSNPLVDANLIDHNEASDSGGGIECYKARGTFINNVLAFNTADYYGGGISISKASQSPVLKNNTVAFNSAFEGGGGLDLYAKIGTPVTVELDNSVFWGSQATDGPEISVRGEATLDIRYSNVAGGQALAYVESTAGLAWGAGMVEGDPLFADAQGLDFHLTPFSPCINRGLSGAPAADADGDARPCMGTVDMGMDEFTGTHPLGAGGFTLSASAGGSVHFVLEAGTANGNRPYLIFGSLSGTAPGIPLPRGAVLPITWDLFTDRVLADVNTPVFSGFMGALDAQGSASAALNVFTPIPGAAGITMSFAYALALPVDLASCPVNVRITP